jgi:hypothetical protein
MEMTGSAWKDAVRPGSKAILFLDAVFIEDDPLF